MNDRAQASLRLWLRMLACTNLIEARVRARLREEFSSTLPRFDMLAQLDACEQPHGLTMGELSRRLMVSNGNVTGLAERLVRERLVTRTTVPHDRRTQRLRLTPSGRRALSRMAAKHRRWIEKMFAGIATGEMHQLYKLIGELKDSIQEVPREQPDRA